MTLVQVMITNELSFPTPTRLITVSSDTRNVLKFGGSDKIITRWKSSTNKIEKISPYCIFGGGGEVDVYNHVKAELLKIGGRFVEDFHEPMKEIVNEMKKTKKYRHQMKKDESSQMFIVGFSEQEIPCLIKFKTGKKEKVTLIKNPFHSTYDAITPSEDEQEILTDFYQEQKGPRQPRTEDELLGTVIDFMFTAQEACHINDQQTVSDEFVYNAILLRDGEYTAFEDKIKFGEEVT